MAPATERQRAYLAGLLTAERLAALTSAEAAFLIAFMVDRPANMSRAQQLFAFRLLGELPRDVVQRVIEGLARLAGRPAATTAPPALPARAVEVRDDGGRR